MDVICQFAEAYVVDWNQHAQAAQDLRPDNNVLS